MIINSANLAMLRASFSAIFQGAYDDVEQTHLAFTEEVPSTAAENIYAWLGELSEMEEWISDRTISVLKDHDYRVKNKDWQKTIGVDRNTILDDTYGQYAQRFKILGRTTARHPGSLSYNQLKNGWNQDCYDGQAFFDTDHPVIGEDGKVTTVANTDGGADAPWFLLCTSEVVKPILFQKRKAPDFVSLDKPTDENVFMRREFLYGVDARYAPAYGHWQMAWGSKQPLTVANYEKARKALLEMKGDGGVPMNLKPDLLVCGAGNEGAAREILMAERNAAGATNKWRGTAELLVSGYLS